MTRTSRSSEKHRPPSISEHPMNQALPRNSDNTFRDTSSPQRLRSWSAQISSIPHALRSRNLSHSPLSSSSTGIATEDLYERDSTPFTFISTASHQNEPSSSMLPRASRHQSIPISFLINPSPQSSPPSPPPPSVLPTVTHLRRASSARHSHTIHPGSSTAPSDGYTTIDTASVYQLPQPLWPPGSSIQSSQVRLNQDAIASSNNQAARLPPPTDHSVSAMRADRNPRRRSHITWDASSNDRVATESINSDARVDVPDTLGERALPESQELPRASVRKTSNPNLKTTKTGKIQRKTEKIGLNKKSTAYNRFLQQRSKYLSEHFSGWTPQQRMKRIAEEWAVSDKNQHKTRRKSRFLGPDGELQPPSLSPLTADTSMDRVPTSETAAFIPKENDARSADGPCST
ncbi:hypothetical protein KVV02_006113 [Mortierella alpina]|uniref:Uncharacterized protein n=1 Tax=Mortierella alpina TaxID=64518 RepID=A0A9P8CZE6_MORAP|nr:hypothetical protein KVV02_006113 [Mortierella alpina]